MFQAAALDGSGPSALVAGGADDVVVGLIRRRTIDTVPVALAPSSMAVLVVLGVVHRRRTVS